MHEKLLPLFSLLSLQRMHWESIALRCTVNVDAIWRLWSQRKKALKCILFKNLLEYEVVRMRAVDGSFAIGRCMFHFFSSSIWYCQRDLFVIAKINSLPIWWWWWWWRCVVSALAQRQKKKENEKPKRILAIIFSFWMNFQQTIINKWID